MNKPLVFSADVAIAGTRAQVWDALTSPERTPVYMFHCVPETDWKPGSPIAWRGLTDGTVYVKGTITSWIPGEQLSFTAYSPLSGLPDTAENYLTTTYTLKSKGSGILLTIAQGDFALVPDGVLRFQEAEGWLDVLLGIKEVVEEDLRYLR